ncbi:hypothetical protein MCOR03_000308 [Pyricularia oryzae]|nr:hypothetical protein MCOR34_002592 [Pyricularia oryzae]KAI6342538.1 hypothetical protein MCOR30_001782 [Pyricularia oryzae]KAI6472598.1 hypothetical protein MCOR15_000365 [Pyricularia oryzae]KAI6540282.1 hypothetical protein MCOR16_000991 [Pyricularia oryzae]KAI6568703.1 hypothetical protein MCOR03_000308 [Pyricularia oryzae]
MPQLLVAKFYWALVQKLEQDISAAVVDGVAHSPAMNHAAELQDLAQYLYRLPPHQAVLEAPPREHALVAVDAATPTVYQHMQKCRIIVWRALTGIGFFVDKSGLVVGVGVQD